MVYYTSLLFFYFKKIINILKFPLTLYLEILYIEKIRL